MNIHKQAFAIVELVIWLSRAQFIFKAERGRKNGREQQPGGQNVQQTRRYYPRTFVYTKQTKCDLRLNIVRCGMCPVCAAFLAGYSMTY